MPVAQHHLSSVPDQIPGYLITDPAHLHGLKSHLAELCQQNSLRYANPALMLSCQLERSLQC